MKQFKYIAAIVLMIVSAAGCREKENPNIKLPINTELALGDQISSRMGNPDAGYRFCRR